MTFSLRICDAQEGRSSSGYTLDGPVLFITPGCGHRGLQLGAQSHHSVKGHHFTIGQEELLPNLLAQSKGQP